MLISTRAQVSTASAAGHLPHLTITVELDQVMACGKKLKRFDSQVGRKKNRENNTAICMCWSRITVYRDSLFFFPDPPDSSVRTYQLGLDCLLLWICTISDKANGLSLFPLPRSRGNSSPCRSLVGYHRFLSPSNSTPSAVGCCGINAYLRHECAISSCKKQTIHVRSQSIAKMQYQTFNLETQSFRVSFELSLVFPPLVTE